MRWSWKGRRYVECSGTDDREAAEQVLLERLAECRLGLRGPEMSRSRTVADLLDALARDYELHERASLPQLQSRLERHLKPHLGAMRAVELGAGHIDSYKLLRKSAGAAPASINRELDHLRAALRLAVENGQLMRAPRVRLFREDNARGGYLDDDRYRALLEALPAYLQPLFVVGFHTGCRRGELLRLTWDRVDFEAKQIFMSPQTTKARAPRTLPIYGDMQRYLAEALRERNDGWPGSDLVFSRCGRPIVDFRKAWRRACMVAGVPGLRFHDMRRTANRTMRRAGVPELVIRRILGHKTDSMATRYGIVNEVDVRAAGDKAEAFLSAEAERRKGLPEPGGRVN